MSKTKRATVVSIESKPFRLLPETYADAKAAEALLSDPNTPSDVRAQLETAILEAAEAMNVSVLHPALVRQAFLEIMRQSAENERKGVPRSIHHFESAVIRLLTITDYGSNGAGPIDVEEEDRLTRGYSQQAGMGDSGLEEHSYRALVEFQARAKCHEICAEVTVVA